MEWGGWEGLEGGEQRVREKGKGEGMVILKGTRRERGREGGPHP